MAYFSNGTEGEAYEAQWCCRCVHQRGPDGDGGCPVFMLHLMHNYDECNNPESMLHTLIPRSAGGVGNDKCTMFIESKL